VLKHKHGELFVKRSQKEKRSLRSASAFISASPFLCDEKLALFLYLRTGECLKYTE
jgi:hypothetical protein